MSSSPKSFAQLVYTRSACARVCGCESAQISRFEVWASVVLVVFHKGQGLRPRFVSKQSFKANFAEVRRQRGQRLGVTQWITGESNKFTVVNEFSQSSYAVQGVSRNVVEARPDRFICTCKDWREQAAAGITTPCCKHVYAVIHKLGLSTLRDYVESVQHGQITRLRVPMTSV